MTTSDFFNRDLSWLSFNERVLDEANDESVPLYERIKFCAIYASNLDEFYRVRIALVKRLKILNKEKLNAKTDLDSPDQLLNKMNEVITKQQILFGKIIEESIVPGLQKNGVHLYYGEPYKPEHLEAVEEIFYSKVLSFMQPIIFTKDRTDPLFLENQHLYIVSDLEKDGIEYTGLLHIPIDELSRFYELPQINGVHYYTFIDDVMREHTKIIFAGFKVKSHSSVKLNRDAELFLREDFSEDIVNKIKKSLNNRKIGSPTRLLHDPKIKPSVLKNLVDLLGLKEKDIVSGGRYHNLFDFFSLPNPIGKELENSALPPLRHRYIKKKSSLFTAIDKRDIFLAFPYHKYDYILRFFNEAAIDPSVTGIKATLYRVASNSHITSALISAARNGKDVQVLVEAKARFDEENNLKWAEKMKEAGVQVRFSKDSLKVHSKIALITRKNDEGSITKYAFFGTGNFNEKTANIYTDYALLTSNPDLTNELEDSLNYILGNKEEITLDHLLVAQVNMPERFLEMIDKEIKIAESGGEAIITLKLNNLQDKKMIKALYRAAEKGVKVELIIRGICCIKPRENINIVRIVDRYLEHSRVYMFNNAGDQNILVGSADWMERNLYRRIELAFPIYDEEVRNTIKYNLALQLGDNVKGVKISDSLENKRVKTGAKPIHSQNDFYKFLQEANG